MSAGDVRDALLRAVLARPIIADTTQDGWTLNELLKSGREIDLLNEFAEAAREELRKHPARPR